MSLIAPSTLAGPIALFATSGPWAGKLAFVLVFVFLLIWLLLMPARLVGHTDGRPQWWRNARIWAVIVTVAQICAYLCWG